MKELISKWYYPKTLTDNANANKRYDYMDNLKFILIILVVVGHLGLKLPYVIPIKAIAIFIYIFHMPCFILTSGYLAKNMNAGGRLRVDRILSVAFMYLLFKLGYVVLGYVFQEDVGLNLLMDGSAPWYLLSLCIWYVLIPMFERFQPIYLITGSILLGLMMGYVSSIGIVFSLSRTFVYLPFFVIGFCLSKEKLESFLNKRSRLLALAFFVVIFISVGIFWNEIKPYFVIIYGASSYARALGDFTSYGILIRGIWYLLAFLLSASIMLLVPRCHTFFSRFGECTLQIYILHSLLFSAFEHMGFFSSLNGKPMYVLFLVMLGGILLTFILANRWFKLLFDKLMLKKLFQMTLK